MTRIFDRRNAIDLVVGTAVSFGVSLCAFDAESTRANSSVPIVTEALFTEHYVYVRRLDGTFYDKAFLADPGNTPVPPLCFR